MDATCPNNVRLDIEVFLCVSNQNIDLLRAFEPQQYVLLAGLIYVASDGTTARVLLPEPLERSRTFSKAAGLQSPEGFQIVGSVSWRHIDGRHLQGLTMPQQTGYAKLSFQIGRIEESFLTLATLESPMFNLVKSEPYVYPPATPAAPPKTEYHLALSYAGAWTKKIPGDFAWSNKIYPGKTQRFRALIKKLRHTGTIPGLSDVEGFHFKLHLQGSGGRARSADETISSLRFDLDEPGKAPVLAAVENYMTLLATLFRFPVPPVPPGFYLLKVLLFDESEVLMKEVRSDSFEILDPNQGVEGA